MVKFSKFAFKEKVLKKLNLPLIDYPIPFDKIKTMYSYTSTISPTILIYWIMEYMNNNQSTTSQYIGPEGDTVLTYNTTENMSNQNSSTSSYIGPEGDTVNTYSTTEGMSTMQSKTQPTSSYVGPAGDTVYVYNGKQQSNPPPNPPP